MIRAMAELILIPTLGSLHLLHPRYNSATPLALSQEFGAQTVILASYSPEGLRQGLWRHEEDLALFALAGSGSEVRGLVAGSEAMRQEALEFTRILSENDPGQRFLKPLEELSAELENVFSNPLSPEVVGSQEWLAPLNRFNQEIAELAGPGPATGFRETRMAVAAQQLAVLPPGRYAVWAEALDYALLAELLPKAARPSIHEPTAAEQERAILDQAWRLENPSYWPELLAALQNIASAEAQFLASQIYLAAGQTQDALSLLEDLSRGEFSSPEYLPGYVLARLGQLYDLSGERERAQRHYRAVLALSWAPDETREAARSGLAKPFTLPPG